MKKLLIAIMVLVFTTNIEAKPISTAQIKKAIIKESIDSYPGNCPCPYNTARNGSRCGGRSAYSRDGGYEPICYLEDVTNDMVKQYKKR